jgi:hypothetical protein
MIFREDEAALADQRLRQGAQVFFLSELAVDNIRFRQLFTELLQVEGIGP